MSNFDKKAFQDQYLNHLERDILMYQKPFPTIEEEFQKIAKKYDKNAKRRDFPGSIDLSQNDNVEFVEKFHSIINASSSKEFKDLKVLNKLAEYDQNANKQLKNLKEGMFVASPISQQIDRCVPENTLERFDTYQKVQRLVDKVIFNTVQELENDLSVLSNRQKQSKVIDRLSNVQLSNGNAGMSVRLPKLKEKNMRMTNKNRSFGGENVTETEIKSAQQIPSMPKDEVKPKMLAGFYVKERKQKLSPEKGKELKKKDYMETFFNKDRRVKNLSKQYLFNLTQYNSPVHDTSSSRVYFDTDVSATHSGQKSFPNIIQTGHFPAETGELLSSRTFGSYLAGNGSYLNNLSSEQTTQLRRTDMSVHDKKPYLSPIGDKNHHTKLKKNVTSTSKPGHKSTKSMSHWLEKEKLMERNSQFIYEGMGLLTLHNGKRLPVQNPSVFTTNYFNLNIDKLEDRDRDYIKGKTGVNIKHTLYDGLINEHDFLRFEKKDLKLL